MSPGCCLQTLWAAAAGMWKPATGHQTAADRHQSFAAGHQTAGQTAASQTAAAVVVSPDPSTAWTAGCTGRVTSWNDWAWKSSHNCKHRKDIHLNSLHIKLN